MHTDSPTVVEHLLAIGAPEEVHIQWSANEKVAFETALGAVGRAAGTGLHERVVGAVDMWATWSAAESCPHIHFT